LFSGQWNRPANSSPGFALLQEQLEAVGEAGPDQLRPRSLRAAQGQINPGTSAFSASFPAFGQPGHQLGAGRAAPRGSAKLRDGWMGASSSCLWERDQGGDTGSSALNVFGNHLHCDGDPLGKPTPTAPTLACCFPQQTDEE